MGTRGFTGFVDTDGRESLSYQQYDSYPTGVGLTVLNYTRLVADWDVVDRQAKALKHVSEAVPPTHREMLALERFTDARVSDRSPRDWYCLLRETQGNPSAILAAGYVDHAPEWPGDSLFCEWGYLIDLQNHMLEVYEGFQRSPHNSGRFVDRVYAPDHRTNEYFPVKLVASFSLSDLPSDETFVKLETDEDE